MNASQGGASKKPDPLPPAPSRDETAAYIADLILELREMADKSGLISVRQWLDKALEEALKEALEETRQDD